MPVSLSCPQGHRLTVSRRYAGKTVRCPECGGKVAIPTLDAIEQKLKAQRERRTSTASRPTGATGKPPPVPRGRREGPAHTSRDKENAATPPREEVADAALPTIEQTAQPKRTPPPLPQHGSNRAVGVAPAERPAEQMALANTESEPTADPEVSAVEPDSPRLQQIEPSQHPASYKPDLAQRWTAYGIGASLAAIGLFGLTPAMIEITEFVDSDHTLPVARWAWLLIFLAAIQLAYGIYVCQLPDWSTAWVTALLGAGLSAMYAFLFGLTLYVGDDSDLIAWLQLDDQTLAGDSSRWCFVMMGTLGLFAYFAGFAALRWRRAVERLRYLTEKLDATPPPFDA
jgi:hypothetical protein